MKILISPVVAVAIGLTGSAVAQEAAGTSDQAKKILDDAIDYLSGLPSLSVKTSVSMKQTMPGQEPREQTMGNTLLFKKDGPFAVHSDLQKGPSFSFVNGKVSFELPGAGIVEGKAKSAAAATVDGTFGFNETGSNPFLDRDVAASLLRGMLFDADGRPWDERLGNFSIDGEFEMDGVKTQRISFTTENEDQGIKLPCKLWVEVGDKPLLRKLDIDMSPIVANAVEQNPQLKGMEISMSGGYADWKTGIDLPAEAFELKIAEGAKTAASIEELMKRGRPTPPADALVGTEAPDFELKLLDGSDFKLSDHKGKVVVLDFWATWCGPCVRALPILMATTREFEKEGVVLVAINLREDKTKVEEFLEKQKWDLTVALDGEGKTGELYKVTGIPQTVTIGKDGKVVGVHVGANPATFKSELTGELKSALGAK